MSDFRLPRLPRNVQLIDPKTGFPTQSFQQWWQSVVVKVETQEGTQDDLLAAVIAAQTAADDAQTAADTAQAAAVIADTAADAAQTSADGANSVASLTSSGVTGCTITATDAGANVTVTISAHTRVYGDGTSVAVNGGSVTALPYSTDEFIYYDQASRLGGAVTYAATTSDTTAAQTGDRHLVGMVSTPAAAAPPEIGDNVRVPGVGGIVN